MFSYADIFQNIVLAHKKYQTNHNPFAIFEFFTLVDLGVCVRARVRDFLYCLTLKMKALQSFETLRTTRPII
jgi:hypothetical protein